MTDTSTEQANKKEIEDLYDDDEPQGDLNCPNCGRKYDEIDYEYQICHYCKYENKKP